ncbi:uncharacterized protein LOC126669262 [Mercurialis annua]|uniref:uncharacterized protein LOC126669262 n=1 Tax=Mercurialis annua TaxID=3986 RepID=UPI002160C54D|nr:uncharacterized protein LOC126669262 [Mercurialis annua]
MGTEILRPQDCLIERIRVSPCRRRNFHACNTTNFSSNPNPNPNPRFNRKPAAVRSEKTDQRKRQPEQQHQQQTQAVIPTRRSNSVDNLKISNNYGVAKGTNSNNFLMEKVTILRRGESLDSAINSVEMIPKLPVTGKCDMYAGSGFAVSPEPSSLPLPSFYKKQKAPVDDSATRDLRRLLRLDL